MSRYSVDPGAVKEEGRAVALHTAVAVLRLMEGYQELFGRDLDRLLIVLAVGVITAERPIRSSDAPAWFARFGTPIPSEDMARCTALSIAAATGIPRETARRKLQDLIADGILRRDDAVGVRVTESLLQQDAFQQLVQRQAAEIARLANALIDRGALVAR